MAATEFSLARRSFHWAIALLLLVQIPLAWYMVDLPLGPDKLGKYALHKSIGMTLFVLAVLRLVYALLSKRPALPVETPAYEKVLARVTQAILYLVVIVMPVTGWIMSSAANFPVSVFGLFTLPNLVEPSKQLAEAMEEAHEAQAAVLLAVLSLHLIGALRHFFIKRDNVLYSMLPLKTFKR